MRTVSDQVSKILVLITGGTFDKEYDEIHGRLFFKDSHLPEMLALSRCRVSLETRTLMMVDSLEMSEADREIIADHCRRASNSRILITHRTDTIVEKVVPQECSRIFWRRPEER
jgi:L-asparaginase